MLIELIGVLETGGPRGAAVPTNPRSAIRFSKGTDVTINLSATTTDGAALPPLSGGAKLTMTVKKNSADTSFLIQKNVTTGAMVFTISSAEQKNIDPGMYVYDVWYTAPTSSKRDPLIPLSPFIIEGTATLPP